MKPELQKIYDTNIAHFGHLEDPKIMGLTIYAEARGEPFAGQACVGTVILERVDHRLWDGNTIQEVCLWPYQFSCYLPSDNEYPMIYDIAQRWDSEIAVNKVLVGCLDIATRLISGALPRDTDLAAAACCQYVTTQWRKYVDAHPDKGERWWLSMKLIKVVDHHEFYS
jgi:hypothetical protein